MHIYELSQKKRNVISKNEGGGSKAVWEFSKKTSSLGNPVTPRKELSYRENKMCSETSEAVGTIWEHAKKEFQKVLKIRITLLLDQ